MVLGCSGESGDDFECSLDSRNGSYLFELDEISGDCGPVPSQVVIIDTQNPAEEGCVVGYNRFSDDECTNETEVTCLDDGLTIEATGVVNQENANHLTGTITFDIEGVCFSTYNATYTRQ